MLTLLIAPTAGELGVFLGFLGVRRLQVRAARDAERQRLAALVGEVLSAAGDLQGDLTAYRVQWATWKAAWRTLTVALAHLFGGGPGRWSDGAAAALGVAEPFRHDRNDAARTALTGSSTRLLAALVHTSLSGNPQLTAASHDLRAATALFIQNAATPRGSSAIDAFAASIQAFRAAADHTLAPPPV
jgi:hypothetical protein